MKTVKYFLIAALSVMTCSLTTSCKDDANDWDSEYGSAPNRQWAPASIGTTAAGDTYINFSGFTVSGATGYVIQVVAVDDITTEPTEATFASAIEKTVGKIGSEDVYKFEGLTSETCYNIRIKAVCTGKLDSNWLLIKKYSDTENAWQYGVKTKAAGEEEDSDDE